MASWGRLAGVPLPLYATPPGPPLLVAHQERTPSNSRMATWDRSFDVQATERTAHPNCGPRRRPGISSHRCTQSANSPLFVYDRGMPISVNVQTVHPHKLAAVRREVAPGAVGSAWGPAVGSGR